MKTINSDTDFLEIERYIKKNNKKIEFDVFFLNSITKKKIIFLIDNILQKYNASKYYEDIIYILIELMTNAIKARYLHLITLRSLESIYPNCSLTEYYNNNEIMKKYSDIFRDDESREKLKDIIRYESRFMNNDSIDIFEDYVYRNLLLFNEQTKKKFVIKLIINITKNDIEFDVINDSPLLMLARTRIDTKRLTFREYYNKDMIESFFLEQLDNSESAGFGLALCDLRLYNNGLEPIKHLQIFEENNQTHSKLIIPIKNTFSHLIFHNKY